MPEQAFIALGSNIEPETNLPRAAERLRELGTLEAASTVYQTAAIGPAAAPDFLNAAVLLETEAGAAQIRTRLRRIEAELGRVRTADKYAPRTIDLDLVMLGAQTISGPELTLPSPDLLTRPFLAVTVAELAPDFRHPISGERLADLAARLRRSAALTPRPDVTAQLRAAIGGTTGLGTPPRSG